MTQLLPTKGFVSYLKYLTNSSPIFVKKDIVLFKIINKTKTELSGVFWTKNWPKIGWALCLSNDWDSIQRLYNYKKDQMGSAAITFNSVFVCRKGWSKYWFCLYIVVFWTRSLLHYLAYTYGLWHGLRTPNEAFFHGNPKLLGSGRQFGQISFLGIWGIFGQYISTHFSTVSPLSIFSINPPLFLQKTKPLYPNSKQLFGIGIWIWAAKN